MTTDDVIRSAINELIRSAPPPPAFPVEQRGRPARRVRVVLAVATALVVGATALVVQRSSDAETGTFVLIPRDDTRSDRLSLVELDSGDVRPVRLPGMGRQTNRAHALIHTAGRFVYMDEDPRRSFPDPEHGVRVFSYPDTFDGRRITLGRADRIVPSARARRVWLVRNFTDHEAAREVDVATGEASREYRLDGGPEVGFGDGLLLHKVGGRFVLWTPTGRERTVLSMPNTYGPSTLYGGIASDTAVIGVECNSSLLCEGLRLVDLRTRVVRAIDRARDVERWYVSQEFPQTPLAPDGKHIVLPIQMPWPLELTSNRQLVLDLDGRVVRRFDDVAASSLWSADGRWVIVQFMDSIVAYRLEDGATKTVRIKYHGPALLTLPR